MDPGFVLIDTRQQGVPVILRELVLPGGFDPVSPSFIVRDITTKQGAPVPSRLQVHLADECQVARNLGPGFLVNYLQPPSKCICSIHMCKSSTIFMHIYTHILFCFYRSFISFPRNIFTV
ncbi:unnamed protein product [Schistosoma margrebowiei]|uniref:Uncharacterized protein n=1 Tax=Schistosoma margrebowiei TaxID=48269 RepID=A0A3P8BZ60_9TREM|nr:unnamed protein product [Schistosoma margrebowiei]